MFKLPDGIPNLKSSAQDWADFAEYNAWQKRGVGLSLLELVREPLMVSDETEVLGIEDDSDKFKDKIDEIASEINSRIRICGMKYPFKLVNCDYGIQYQQSETLEDIVYRYLLMCTRVKMTKNGTHANINGALLFERLSAIVAKSFLGSRAEAIVFGTSKKGGFREKLEELVHLIGEGGNIHSNPGHKPQDDNVDVVVWKGFTDKFPSQLIAFGQCKTGTSWSDKLSELNMEAFCRTWFTRQPVLMPVRLFFCAQYFPRDIWQVRANEAGLVFDRFRIMDYLPEEVDASLLADIETWTNAAFSYYNNVT